MNNCIDDIKLIAESIGLRNFSCNPPAWVVYTKLDGCREHFDPYNNDADAFKVLEKLIGKLDVFSISTGQDDFDILQGCMSGANVPVGLNCMGP